MENNIDTLKKNKETLIDASREVDIETDLEKTEYTLLSPNQTAGPNHYRNVANI
jgi:hypothetical protein